MTDIDADAADPQTPPPAFDDPHTPVSPPIPTAHTQLSTPPIPHAHAVGTDKHADDSPATHELPVPTTSPSPSAVPHVGGAVRGIVAAPVSHSVPPSPNAESLSPAAIVPSVSPPTASDGSSAAVSPTPPSIYRTNNHLRVSTADVGGDIADIDATTVIHSSPSAVGAADRDFAMTPIPIHIVDDDGRTMRPDDDDVKDEDEDDTVTQHFYISPSPVISAGGNDNDDDEVQHRYTPAPSVTPTFGSSPFASVPVSHSFGVANSSHPIGIVDEESDDDGNDIVNDLLDQKDGGPVIVQTEPYGTNQAVNVYSHQYLNTGLSEMSDESEPGMDLASPRAVVGEVDDFRRANSVMSHFSDLSNYAYNYGTLDSEPAIAQTPSPYQIPISPMSHAAPMPIGMSLLSYQNTMSQRSPHHNPTYSYQYVDNMSPVATLHGRNLQPPSSIQIDQHQYGSLSSSLDVHRHSPHRQHHRNVSNSSAGSILGPSHSPPSYDEVIVNSPEGYTPSPYLSPPPIGRMNGEEKEGEGAIEGRPVPDDVVARFAAVNSPSVSSVLIPINGVAPSVQPLQRHIREEKNNGDIEMVRGGDGFDKTPRAVDPLVNRNREGGGSVDEAAERAERHRRRKERREREAAAPDLPPPTVYFPFFTIFIGCAFVAIFIGCMYMSGSSGSSHWEFDSWYNNPMYGPDVGGLVFMGAKYTPYIISATWSSEQSDWWRVIAPIVLHAGIIHVVLNTAFFLTAAFFLERSFSAIRLLPIWLSAGIFGEMLSALLAPTLVGVGGSAGTCGLVGAYWSDFFHHHHYMELDARRIYLIKLSVVTVFLFPLGIFTYVDNWANLGALIAGTLTGNIILNGAVPHPVSGNRINNWPLVIVSAVTLFIVYGAAAGLLWGYHALHIDSLCHNCHYVGCIDTAYWSCQSNLPLCDYDGGPINCN